MKTLKSINEEIQQIIEMTDSERAKQEKVKKSVLSRRKKRVEYLNVIKGYLLSSPTEEFMKQEILRLENRLDKISEGYFAWCDLNGKEKNNFTLSEYNKVMEVKKHKDHIKNIRYILN